MRGAEQGVFAFKSRGGPRPGAGRKPKGARAGVSHRQRAALAARHPVHVTLRLRPGLASLRTVTVRKVLERAFAAACERFDTRLVHYSVMSNHVHMIVESKERRTLSRAMQGFTVRVAKALNKVWNRKGPVFADRYHDRILRTPREVRHALAYVLRNHARHGIELVGLDPFASGQWFDGWREPHGVQQVAQHLARARTWLLGIGWRKWGPIELDEVPRGAR